MHDYSLIILAGGAGIRMGGRDKGLLVREGTPLVEQVLARLAPPPAHTLISANRNLDSYRMYADRVIRDLREGRWGPLAGLEAALSVTTAQTAVVVPCDMPALPADLAVRLLDALAGPEGIAVAHDGERLQPLCMALHAPWPLTALRDYLDGGGRSVHGWLERTPHRQVHFPEGPAAFRNLNAPRPENGPP